MSFFGTVASVRAPSAAVGPTPGVDQRGAPRFAARRALWLAQPTFPRVPGELVNLSMTGASVRISASIGGENDYFRSHYHRVHRRRGDELFISGLLAKPVCCWIVAADDDILRVHLMLTPEQRDELRVQIARLGTRI